MNILWDLRLFSHGFANRGIGHFTLSLTDEIARCGLDHNIVAWGDRHQIPEPLKSIPKQWIPYSSGNWKKDLFTIPLLILKHKIDIFHYWLALGPLWHIGIGSFHSCPTVATIYDLGTELWDVPFLRAVKQSHYWSFQKRLAGFLDKIICISSATRSDLEKSIPSLKGKSQVIYMPHPQISFYTGCREPYFIVLGGSPHKNCARVVEAFAAVRKEHPHYRLLILGEIDKSEERLETVPENVSFEKMDRYDFHLQNSSGLLFCSVYEGLGIPPLEAMARGCPIVASEIPSLKETCKSAACFVNPLQVRSISGGIFQLVTNNEIWANRSRLGAEEYKELCINSGRHCIEIYEELVS